MKSISGRVQSGGTSAFVPLADAYVTLLEATGGDPVLLGTTRSDRDGSFVIVTAKTSTNGTFYVKAELPGAPVILLALLGPSIPGDVVVNELTTVSAVFCAAQFIDGTDIKGSATGLRVAAGMNTNVVDVTKGAPSPVLLGPPNADQTNALRSTRSLANLLASCARGGTAEADELFDLTTPPGGKRPGNTMTAMFNIARDPANQVAGIYTQSQSAEVYSAALEAPPDAWTLAVKVNNSGDDAHMFGGPANIVFDKAGRAWITNNVVQGTLNSTEWSIVLGPEGRPDPVSPFTGGGLIGPGFGIDMDSKDQVWIGNFGWGDKEDYPKGGSVSVFNMDAVPQSNPDGFKEECFRVQGTVVDDGDNVWLASYGNSRVVVYPNGDSSAAIFHQGVEEGDQQTPETFLPFDIAITKDGDAWVTNSNSLRSTISRFRIAGGALELLTETAAGHTVKGIAIDSLGFLWTGSGGDNMVYAFDPDGALIGGFQGGGLDGPWGVSVDGDDHVWAANFGPLRKGSDFTGRLSKFAGANPDTRPEGVTLGHPLTPESGYTLKNAGDPILLHDLTPLYGPDGPACYTPLMRVTSVNFDAAGNIWACNNWKPDFDIDRESNPGGDGIVIFIGLAKPPRER
ncbi:MAG: hypothetical protein ACXW31_14975 [Thermoanaerobaculia bacterium]